MHRLGERRGLASEKVEKWQDAAARSQVLPRMTTQPAIALLQTDERPTTTVPHVVGFPQGWKDRGTQRLGQRDWGQQVGRSSFDTAGIVVRPDD